MNKPTVILDCDPGLDDAVAILLAITSQEDFDLAGITTVAGNVPLHHTYRNARAIVELAGYAHVPVFEGCARAMMSEGARADEVHGADGIGGVALPQPKAPLQKQHAVDFIIDTCRRAEDHGVTLCPVGPMTNIALALIKAPDIKPKIREIVFMGGVVFGPGNTTPAAEFNIYADPHAAHVVMESGVPITMMGLDVTQQTIITGTRLESFRNLPSEISQAVTQMLSAYREMVIAKTGGTRQGVLHDPCTIAYLIQPDLFKGTNYFVDVDHSPSPNFGRTSADGLFISGKTPNVKVMMEVDDHAFYELIFDRLSRLK